MLDTREPRHQECLDVLSSWPGPLVLPSLCLCEVTHIVGKRLGWRPEAHLLAALAAAELSLEPVHPADLERMAALVFEYRDLPLGTTDAAVVAAAERLEVTTIATLDRRHFSVVRPAHVDAFELVP